MGMHIKQASDFSGRFSIIYHDGQAGSDFVRIADEQNVRTAYPDPRVPWNAWNGWSANNYSDGLSPYPYSIYVDDAGVWLPPGEPVLPAIVEDQFSSAPVDSGKWTDRAGDGAPVILAGAISIPLSVNYSGVGSTPSTSFVGKQFTGEIKTMPSGPSSGEAYFSLGKDGSNNCDFIFYRTGTPSLILRRRVAGVVSGDVTLTYSSTDHKYLSFCEKDGTFYWLTSPDNVTWTIRRQVATNTVFDLTSGIIGILQCGFWDGAQSAGGAVFEVERVFESETVSAALT
jgi:hypothetical protein